MAKATGVEVARISVRVSPDTKKFRSELQRELNEIERTMKGDVEVTAHLNSAQARADFQRMKSQLQSSGNVKLGVDVVEGKTSKASSSAKEDNKQLQEKIGLLQRLKNSLTEMPNFGTGINVTGYLVIGTLLATVLAPLAGLLTASLMALPGLISLVATPIAALTLGLDGLKAAAEQLKAPFEDLKATMSSAVQEQFTPVFERLQGIFPTLKAALPSVTQGLADMLNSVVGAATSPEGLEMIRATIENIGAALTAAAPGIGSFTSALMRLAENFTGGALQGLVEWFNGAMASFDQFVAKLDASGDLDKIFSALGESLKIVVDGLGKIAMIGLDTLKDPEAMAVFNAALTQTVAVITALFAISKAFLNAIATGAQLAGSFFRNLTTSAQLFLAFITAIPNAIASGWTGAVAAAQSAWDTVVGVVRAAIQTVVGVVYTLATNLGAAWEAVKAGAAAAWNGLTAIIQSAWDAAVAAIQAAISTVIAVVAALPGQISSALGDLAGLLVASGRALIQGFINGIKGMIGVAVDAAKSVVSAVRNLFPFSPAKEGPFSGKGWVYYSGLSVGEGFASGIAASTQTAVDAAKDMAAKIKQAIDSGAESSIADVTSQDLKSMLATLEEEKKRLKVQKNSLEDKEARKSLQTQIDQIQAQKDILSYQKDRIDNEKTYSDTAGQDPFLQTAKELMNMPIDFAKATGSQFLSDMGISGSGALSTLANTALDWGSQFVFNVSNIDEAMSVQKMQQSKQALSFGG